MQLKKIIYLYPFLGITLLACKGSDTDFVKFPTTPHVCKAQNPPQISLIVAEYLKGYQDKGGNFTYLTRYNFQEGKFVSKDTILGVPSRRNDSMNGYMNFDWGNQLYKNRYIISSYGSVLDLQTHKFICAEGDEFIRNFGDSLIFHRDTIYSDDSEHEKLHKLEGTGYWLCNLNTKKYELAKPQSGMALQGLLSPDLKHGLEVDMAGRRLKPFAKPYKIILHDAQQKTKNIVENCGFGTPQSKISSHQANVPVLWVDNTHFVYGKYLTPVLGFFKSVKSQVEIRLVNIETASDKLIGTIKCIPPSVGESNFFKKFDDSLIFECQTGDFRVDLQTQKIKSDSYHSVNHQFESKFDKLGVEIQYNHEKIGKIWCSNVKTTCGYFAAEYGDMGSNLGYPKGIKIWNSHTREWTTIDIPWIATLIGWQESTKL